MPRLTATPINQGKTPPEGEEGVLARLTDNAGNCPGHLTAHTKAVNSV